MPYKNPEDRKYTKAAKAYDGSEAVMEKRRARNRARYALEKEGMVSVGDGKDVAHKLTMTKGGTNARSNLKVEAAGANRSFARNGDHSLKTEVSKRERKPKK